MIIEWRKFKGWLVLEYFLKNPNMKIHIKDLSRKLGVSPRTVQTYCKLYKKYDILNVNKVANILQFSLRNEDVLVKELKKMWFLSIIREYKFIENILKTNENIISIVLYGTYARGDYTNESDIDILVIVQDEKLEMKPFINFEGFIGKNVEVTKFTIGKWREMVRKKMEFAGSVFKNHIVLWGEEL